MLRKDVERFVANCHVCQRTKTSQHTPYGVLNPLPVPECPWRDISIDFVTGLPISDGYDAIWVVIDWLTKMRHLIPCSTTVDAKELANLFVMNIFRLHGLPNSILSDRGPQFASRFWKYLCNSLYIKPHLSTAFHPETDGQTERINSVMEQYLRAYINYQQDNWAQYLPLAKFAANNHVSKTTGLSPFFTNYGMHPKLDFEPDL
jgi:transposase InsO family protein